ncbi:MAG: DUF1566 domain-containing protein [Eubacteriales bacterium]|nr:DUF1566 domain-containing protein [Eubacteriales bacterium]
MKKIIPFALLILLIFFKTENIESSPASVSYSAGDIILSDGSIVKTKDFNDIDSSNPPMAVIVELQDDETVLGLGVHRSEEPLPWEIDETAQSDMQPNTAESENSPALVFVNTYAKTYVSNDDYASGWYMPDISELHAIYDNRKAINASLEKIYQLDNNASMDELGTNWYWASTPSKTSDDYAWFMHFFNGYASDCSKNFTNVHVLAVRKFQAEGSDAA